MNFDDIKTEAGGFIELPQELCGEWEWQEGEKRFMPVAGERFEADGGERVMALDPRELSYFLIRHPQYKNIMIPKNAAYWPQTLMNHSCVLNILIHPTLKYLDGSFWSYDPFENDQGGRIYYTGTEEQWHALLKTRPDISLDYTDYDAIVSFVDPETFRLPAIDYKGDSVRYSEQAGEVVIPASYTDADGHTQAIREVGMLSFAYNEDLTKVIIPPTVHTVGMDAFRGCKNLEEVIFEDSEEEIEICCGAFYDCVKLSRVRFGRKANIQNFAFCREDSKNACEISIETSDKLDLGEFYNPKAFH